MHPHWYQQNWSKKSCWIHSRCWTSGMATERERESSVASGDPTAKCALQGQPFTWCRVGTSEEDRQDCRGGRNHAQTAPSILQCNSVRHQIHQAPFSPLRVWLSCAVGCQEPSCGKLEAASDPTGRDHALGEQGRMWDYCTFLRLIRLTMSPCTSPIVWLLSCWTQGVPHQMEEPDTQEVEELLLGCTMCYHVPPFCLAACLLPNNFPLEWQLPVWAQASRSVHSIFPVAEDITSWLRMCTTNGRPTEVYERSALPQYGPRWNATLSTCLNQTHVSIFQSTVGFF